MSIKSYLLNSTNETTFATNLALNSFKFKVIIHKKAYDLQTLVGNCGGYIGLILGKLLNVSETGMILLSAINSRNFFLNYRLGNSEFTRVDTKVLQEYEKFFYE